MKQISFKKQQGFSILAVILVIVAVIVAIGVWALSGQTNTSSSGNSASNIHAASIVNDGSAIKLAYDTLVMSGYSPSTIIFMPNVASTPTAPNILDPVTGLQTPKINLNIIKAGATATEGFWVHNAGGLRFSNVGTNAAADPVILLAGIKKNICESINITLYGSSSIPTTVFSTSSASAFGATPAAPQTATGPVDLTGVAGISGWTSGCVTTVAGGDSNFYFRVLKAN